jgi:hypothetical protein
MTALYQCTNERRRELVRAAVDGSGQPLLNGIDYLEIDPDDQARLLLRCLQPVSGLGVEHVVIEGGTRLRNIRATEVSARDNVLTIRVNAPGDFSSYALRLVRPGAPDEPPPGFDSQLREVSFSFKVHCPSDFDCRSVAASAAQASRDPDLNYLAKDYTSFRQLMLDRINLLLPAWREQSPADMQMALIELLAYVGDQLSYYQDASATEAYLATARRRVSVRRHARLLDYRMHEGLNARAWVVLEVESGSGADGAELPIKSKLLTKGPRGETLVADFSEVMGTESPEVFETLHAVTLRANHDCIEFYTWRNESCCLPLGSTRATLLDGYDAAKQRLLKLAKGDLLLFEELRSAATGSEADRDLTRRHVVRLIAEPVPAIDALDGTAVLEIAWHAEDALPFCLCVSSEASPAPVSIARGNLVLADHGRSFDAEVLEPGEVPVGGNYRPRLTRGPLTFKGPDDDRSRSADWAMHPGVHDASPALELFAGRRSWTAQHDLLSSDQYRAEFVVETESDGSAVLRFGDGILGKRPAVGTRFTATYRVGNGSAGNVGAEAITRVVFAGEGITSVRNPLPASGGIDPESLEQVRQFAPRAYRTQERAVTEADYAALAERHPEVQKAAATYRWTGSWYTAFISVDRKGGLPVDAEFAEALKAELERYRMAGNDVEVCDPLRVPLDLALRVCVAAGYFRSTVKASLLDVFSSRLRSDGQRGFFHPDNFSFGQAVYLSQIYQAALAVAGVASVEIVKLQRFGQAPNQELEAGVLFTSRLEIVRLDNDPNFPENGKLELMMYGGM